jgi:hypothetical protein
LNSGGNATAFVVQQPTGQSDRDSKTQLKDMVPLLQSLVWALLVGAIVIVLRSEIGGVLQGRHVKLSIAGVEIEIFAPEQVTNPLELEVVE